MHFVKLPLFHLSVSSCHFLSITLPPRLHSLSFSPPCLRLWGDRFSSSSLSRYASLSPQFISLLSVLVTAAGCLLMFSGGDKLFHTSNIPLPSPSSSPAGIWNLFFFLSLTNSASFCCLGQLRYLQKKAISWRNWTDLINAASQPHTSAPSPDRRSVCYLLHYLCARYFLNLRASSWKPHQVSKWICITI